MAWPETSNSLDDPPCVCGNDLGDEGRDPQYVPNTAGYARPTGLVGIAVEVPASATTILPTHSGGQISRVELSSPGYHVMYDPFGSGSQFHLDAHLLSGDDSQVGSFERVSDFDVEPDPRTILLRHFWEQQRGYQVRPFAVRRSGMVEVLGRISIVRVGSRWFDARNVHSHLGATTVLKEGKRVRFLDSVGMRREFSAIELPDGQIVPPAA